LWTAQLRVMHAPRLNPTMASGAWRHCIYIILANNAVCKEASRLQSGDNWLSQVSFGSEEIAYRFQCSLLKRSSSIQNDQQIIPPISWPFPAKIGLRQGFGSATLEPLRKQPRRLKRARSESCPQNPYGTCG
jgi:hypothetical protein